MNPESSTVFGTRFVENVDFSTHRFSKSSQFRPAGGQNGIPSSVINLLNVVLGGGLMGIHTVPSEIGLIGTAMSILGAGLLSTITLRFVATAALMSSQRSYDTIGVAGFGEFAGRFFIPFWIVLQLGGAMLYYTTISITNSGILNDQLGLSYSGETYAVLIAIFILAPLVALPSISFLAPSSFMALAIFFLLGFIIILVSFGVIDNYYVLEQTTFAEKFEPLVVSWLPPKTLTIGTFMKPSLGIVILGFSGHPNFLDITADMAAPTLSNMTIVAVLAMGLAGSLYSVAALFGGYAFGNYVSDTVTLNMRSCYKECLDGTWAPTGGCPGGGGVETCLNPSIYLAFVQFLVLIAIILGFPSLNYSVRIAMMAMLRGPYSSFSWFWHLGIGWFNVIWTLLIAIFFSASAGKIFGNVGKIAAPMVSWILPAAFYIRISLICGVSFGNPKIISAVLIIIFGLTFSALSLLGMFTSAFNDIPIR